MVYNTFFLNPSWVILVLTASLYVSGLVFYVLGYIPHSMFDYYLHHVSKRVEAYLFEGVYIKKTNRPD